MSYTGLYRGIVVNSSDPLGLGRIQVQVPQLMGMATSGWALPVPMASIDVPAPGDQVMVTFEGGDLSHPLYHAATSGGAAQALTTAEQALSAANAAQASANTAEADAQTGIRNAAAAQSSANSAQSTANSAQSAANTAQSAANKAETDAQTGISNAAAAQTAANQAQSTANSAQTAATSGLVTTDRLRSATAARDSGMLTQLAADLAPDLPAKSITGAMLADAALNGKTGDSLTLTNTTVNGQTLADTGWTSDISMAYGFANYNSTIQARVRNGVLSVHGLFQVTVAQTAATSSDTPILTFGSTIGNAISAVIGTSTNHYQWGSFTTPNTAGSGVITGNYQGLWMSYRTGNPPANNYGMITLTALL